jgi:stage III sporulation protein AE
MIFIITAAGSVYAENDSNGILSPDIIIDEQANSVDIKEIEKQLDKYAGSDIKKIIEDYDPKSIIKDIAKGKYDFNAPGILNKILKYLFCEIYENIYILVTVLVIAIFCAILKNLQASFLNGSTGEIAFFACYTVIVTLIVFGFGMVMQLGMDIIDDMVGFMYATLPLLIALLVSGGNFVTGGVLQPFLIMITEVSASVIKNTFMPVVILATGLAIVNNISEKIQLSRLAKLLKQIIVTFLGLILTIFIGIVTIQGSLGGVADGITGKTAKFAIGFIPVVGNYLADATDTVIGCTLLIKNAAGTAVMIGIIVICLVPLLKILAMILLYKLTCAIVEPLSEKRITNCINDVANSIVLVFGIVFAVAFMFLISVSAIIGAGNLSTMIR